MVKYLPYVKVNIEVMETRNGFQQVNGLDSMFRGYQARDKVICKSDLFDSLSDIFEENTLKNYRDVVYAVISGNVCDAVNLSKYLTALYTSDQKFKMYIATMFYLEEKETPFGIQIMESLLEKIRMTEEKWKNHFKHYGCKVFFIANCCMYYAVDDVGMILTIPDDCNCEVLSNAKVWKGTTQRQGQCS